MCHTSLNRTAETATSTRNSNLQGTQLTYIYLCCANESWSYLIHLIIIRLILSNSFNNHSSNFLVSKSKQTQKQLLETRSANMMSAVRK